MPFSLDLLPEHPDIKRIEENDSHSYLVKENGEFIPFPSVTSILSSRADNSWIQEWKDRVGEEEANRVGQRARNYGTCLHELMEAHTLGKNLPRMVTPDLAIDFSAGKKIVEENINIIYATEKPIFSRTLHAAGTCDGVVSWQGLPGVIDYKTTKHPKTEEDCLHYFLQATAYGYMLEEMYPDFLCLKIIIVLFNGTSYPTIFVKDPEDYYDRMMEIFLDTNS